MTIIFVAFCFGAMGAMFAPSLMDKEIKKAVNNGIVLM